jgi:hypothetical protein
MRDLMPGRSRQPIDGHVGNAGTEAGVWATLVVVSHPLQQDVSLLNIPYLLRLLRLPTTD